MSTLVFEELFDFEGLKHEVLLIFEIFFKEGGKINFSCETW